jgi:hypothetical protein
MSLPRHGSFLILNPGDISLPERNQNVSNNSNGTLIDQEMIGHNVSQILLSTGMQPSIHVGLSSY